MAMVWDCWYRLKLAPGRWIRNMNLAMLDISADPANLPYGYTKTIEDDANFASIIVPTQEEIQATTRYLRFNLARSMGTTSMAKWEHHNSQHGDL
eukprot:gene8976-2955_t